MRLKRSGAVVVCAFGFAVYLAITAAAAQDSSRGIAAADELMEQASRLGTERRFEEAAALARRAVDEYAALAPGTPNHPEALRLLGTLQYQAQHFREAADTFALELQVRQGGMPDDAANIARTLNDLANTRRSLGQLVDAKELLQRALAMQRKGLPAEDLRIGETAINLASLQSAVGDRAGAEANFNLALSIYYARDEANLDNQTLRNKAALLNNLAQMYFRAGEFASAVVPLRRSIALREKSSPNPATDPSVLLAYANLAAVQQERGELDDAAGLYERVIDSYTKIPNAPQTNTASAVMNLAMVRLLQGNYAAAEPLYRKALELRQAVLGPRHVDVAGTYERLAVFEQVVNRPEEAFRDMARSTEIHEENLRSVLMSGSDQQRQAYMTTVQENLDIALSLRAAVLEQHADASAWAATLVMRRKGRVLDAAATMTDRLASRMTGDERQLFDKLATARAQLSALVLQSTEAPAGQRDATRRQLETDIDSLESALAARSREFAAELRPIDVATVREQLPVGTVLVEYVRYRPFNPKAIGRNNRFGEPRYAAFVLTRSGAPRWFELGPAEPIERSIRSFRNTLRVPSSPARQSRGIQAPAASGVRTAGRDLGRLLLDPMQAELSGAERILFAPDGELSVIPFAALQIANWRQPGLPGAAAASRFLIEQAEIDYLTSGRDLVSRPERIASSEPPLIVADPRFDAAQSRDDNALFRPLPGTAQEADALRALIPNARVLTGPNATEHAIKTANGPRVLHVATHGFFLNAAPQVTDAASTERGGIALAAVDPQSLGRQALLRSGLALAGANQRQGGDGDDGLLTALEAASLDLRGTQLVVLSACDTGLGEIRSGDGVYGLRRALTVAGAESQVMSLWQVSDRATRDLMIGFYRQLSEGAGRAAALRSVQLQFLKSRDWSHPYYWAAFVVAGAWDPLRE